MIFIVHQLVQLNRLFTVIISGVQVNYNEHATATDPWESNAYVQGLDEPLNLASFLLEL